MNLAIICTDISSPFEEEGIKKPKYLLKIGGENIIERLIRIARENCFKNIFFILNQEEPGFRHFLAGKEYSIPIHISVKKDSGWLESIFALSPFMLEGRFCIASAARVFDEYEFSDFLDYTLLQEDADGTAAVMHRTEEPNPICIAMDDNESIIKFSDAKEGYSWCTGGIYTFSSDIFNEMEPAVEQNMTSFREFLKLLISREYKLKGFAFTKIFNLENSGGFNKADSYLQDQHRTHGIFK